MIAIVQSRIRGDLGLKESFEFLLIRLERVLPRGDKLFVLLDSVERCEDRPALASGLDDLVQVIRGRPVRLVVTCRTFAWSGFATQPGGQMSMRSFATNVFPSSSRVQPEADVRNLGRPVDIEPFGPEEFAEAWNGTGVSTACPRTLTRISLPNFGNLCSCERSARSSTRPHRFLRRSPASRSSPST